MTTPTKPEKFYYVKVLQPGHKRWDFLGRGCATHLRIHALMFTQNEAEQAARAISDDNPGVFAKPVRIGR